LAPNQPETLGLQGAVLAIVAAGTLDNLGDGASLRDLGSHMDNLLNRLRRALLQGAALAAATGYAGCGDDTTRDQPDPSDAAISGDAATTNDDGSASMELVPYAVDRLGCYGEDYGDGFGYHGRCCLKAQCYTPTQGVCETNPGSLPGRPTGSGSCACGATAGIAPVAAGHNLSLEGPYLPNPDDEPSSPGSCCYLVATIKCDGRPLIVDDHAIVAPLTTRDDWMRFA